MFNVVCSAVEVTSNKIDTTTTLAGYLCILNETTRKTSTAFSSSLFFKKQQKQNLRIRWILPLLSVGWWRIF